MKDEQSNITNVEITSVMLSTLKDLKYIVSHSELAIHPSSFMLFKDIAPCDDVLWLPGSVV
jgi:hypothetical protein